MAHSHHHKHDQNHRYEATKKVTLIGALTNILLSVMQLLGGFLTHSHALIADGLHTLSDLVSDFIVLIAAKHACRDADNKHPYGHRRYETVATILLGAILGIVGISIGFEAVERLSNLDDIIRPEPLALIFAMVTIIAKEVLYRYTMHSAKKLRSSMLEANAWHHRSDAISSGVVFIGVIGAAVFDIIWLDTMAAVIVSLMILHIGFRLIKNSLAELVDTAVEEETVQEIKHFIQKLDGVINLHMLRTRKMGGKIVADVHVQVDTFISVSEGHYIADCINFQLKKHFTDLDDIIVHIDPENDEIEHLSHNLESREKFLAYLQTKVKHDLNQDIEQLILHYLNGEISVEIKMNQQYSIKNLEILINACKTLDSVKKVSIYQQVYPVSKHSD